jgi:hypothetical protein
MSEAKQPVMQEIHSLEEIPEFTSEAEEAEFWATHSLGEELLERMEPIPEEILPPQSKDTTMAKN